VSDAQDEMDLGVVGALFQVALGVAARALVLPVRSLETGADGERLGVVGIERERAVDGLGPLVGAPIANSSEAWKRAERAESGCAASAVSPSGSPPRRGRRDRA
jgi:hypothetical protein